MEIIWSPRGQRRLAEYARGIVEYDYPQTAVNWLPLPAGVASALLPKRNECYLPRASTGFLQAARSAGTNEARSPKT